MSFKIIACAIGGDNVSQEDWDRFAECVSRFADEVVIGDNGTDTYRPDFKDVDVTYLDQIWEGNFAKARNEVLAEVRSRHDADPNAVWIWLDTDDNIDDVKTLRPVLEKAFSNPVVGYVYLPYQYDWDKKDPESGLGTVQWRERVFRCTAPVRWQYRIHEQVWCMPGFSFLYLDAPKVRHWGVDVLGEDPQRRARNRSLLARAMQEEPNEARYILYMAHEHVQTAMDLEKDGRHEMSLKAWASAYKLYEIVSKSGIGAEESYITHCRLAECLRALEQPHKAMDHDLQALKVSPQRPEAKIGLANSALQARDYVLATEWATDAIETKGPEMSYAGIDKTTPALGAYYIRASAYEALQQWDKAIDDTKQLVATFKQEHMSEKVFELAATRDRLAGLDALRTRRRTEGRGQGSIAFVCRPLPEVWHPVTMMANGSGGTERCIAELAKRFAQDGWNVAVFGTPGVHEGIDEDGVEWWDEATFSRSEEFEVVVAVRAPELIAADDMRHAQKLLWCHDVNIGPLPNRVDGKPAMLTPDKIICLTDWHAKHTKRVYSEVSPITVIGNGFESEIFYRDSAIEKVQGSFVYTSSPDRGLDTLLSLWLEIKKRMPDATLDIFYGWDMLEIAASRDETGHLLQFRDGIKANMARIEKLFPGSVRWRGRVNAEELARGLNQAQFWVYPTSFLETFCRSALEAQACGAVPVVCQIGALHETVASGIRLQGYADNFAFQKKWVDALENIYNSPDDAEVHRHAGYAFVQDFTWDNQFERWRETITAGRR